MKPLLVVVLLASLSLSVPSASVAFDPASQPVLARALAQFQTCSLDEARLAVQILASRPADAGKDGLDLRTQLESVFRAFSNFRSTAAAENATAQTGFMKGMLDRKLREADAAALTMLDEPNRRTFAFVLNTLASESELAWRSVSPEDSDKRIAWATAKQAAFQSALLLAGAERDRADAAKRIQAATRSFRVVQVLDSSSVLAREYTPAHLPGSLSQDVNRIMGRSTRLISAQEGDLVYIYGSLSDDLVDGSVFSAPVEEDGRHQYTTTLGALATVRKFRVLE